MSEGYEEQPVKLSVRESLSVIMIAAAFCLPLIMTVVTALQVQSLRAENASLRKQLDWYTCERQTELLPVPEQVQSPTLIELSDHPSIEAEIAAAMQLPVGIVGSPVQDLRAEYASKYRKAHLIKVAEVGRCEGCGIVAAKLEVNGKHLETHHEISVKRIFDEGLDHSLIYDPNNFCVFCRTCHHDFGHPNGWGDSNPNVRRDAAKHLKSLHKTTVAP